MFPKRFVVKKKTFEIIIFNNTITMDYGISLILKLIHLESSCRNKTSLLEKKWLAILYEIRGYLNVRL